MHTNKGVPRQQHYGKALTLGANMGLCLGMDDKPVKSV